MSKKNYQIASWTVFAFFVLFAILIVIANFLVQIIFTNLDPKIALLINSIFIILNVISLSYLLFLLVWNAMKQNKNLINNIVLCITTSLYIFFSLGSSLILFIGNNFITQIFTMCFYIFALFSFPLIVMSFVSKKFKTDQRLNWAIIVFLILYLSVNFALLSIIMLSFQTIIPVLVTVTSLNLISSCVFFGLLTHKSIKIY